MVEDNGLIENSKNKGFKQKKIKEFLDEYADSNLKFTDERIKLCSSDDFNELADVFKSLQKQKHAPIMISQVGGFYVMASLAGHAADNSRTKPVLLFFDKKTNNIANAIYNTLLMQACDTKERYIATLFGLDDKDIIISLDENKYIDYIVQVFKEKEDTTKIDKKRITIKALRKYKENKEEYDEIIAKEHDLAHRAMRELEENFNIANIEKYAESKKYDKEKHLNIINKAIEGKLSKEHKALFEPIAKSMTDYLAKGENYYDLVNYLSRDIQKNQENHILCNDDIYEGYKSLISKKGQSSVKFVPGVDISTEAGINKLEKILTNEGFINKNDKPNNFPIDIAFLPHIETFQGAYPFIKKNVEKYIRVNRENANNFSMHPTASLHVRTYDSIGANFIEEERKSRKPLTHLTPIEKQEKGFPLLTFIAGANIGNIYNSEVDLQNVIDMAIADKVDTVYIQGLIYSTYYHNQTNRRLLVDPKYETLDQRLKAAKKLVKKLNDNGIKVVYQMGDEEYHLYEDMFKIYTREQGVKGNDFLRRDDLKSAHDWVRPIIIQELIPYLIRSGEDLTNFYTDEERETRVTELCNALKNYKEGLPLGELAKYIKPEFLKDTDMFRVVYSTIDRYDKDPALSVNILSNPNFSTNAQYSNPTGGIIKNLKIYQTGALGSGKLAQTPQLFVDGRQGMMSISYRGDQVTMNVPQMIDDAKYIEHPELLSGIKEHITSDPTHARVTKGSTRPNYPGSWTITGDAREKMTIVPYWKRAREVMDYVNKTGKGLEEIDVFYLNDIQAGSLTERLEYTLKALDHFYYDYPAPKGIWGNGDFQQGWNYSSFANESRHLGTMSVAGQMEDFIKLIRPWMRESFGVIDPTVFVGKYPDYKIDKETAAKIMTHLSSVNVIDSNKGINHNTDLIKDGVDYKKVDLKLPPDLQPYEDTIREKLSNIKLLKFIHLAEGNHEYNSDWDKKGFNLIKLLRQELNGMKDYSGADTEIALSEFIINKRGDILQAPHGSKTVNGYNVAYSHLYRAATGETPTKGMSKHFDRMGDLSNEVHRAFMGHLHVFETSVIDNKLFSITGSGAGQSGFEQNLGLASRPLFVIDRYLPDGRVAVDTIGTEFLKNYKIQNPVVKAMGLENFIDACLTEEVGVYGFNGTPKDIQPVHQRKLVIAEPNKIVGPKID
ncbi:MAG: hypothetical protein IJG68_00880 [Bacilli bacterium]|nr:hypothetical protein [Bacilli bacterium]